MNWKWAFLVLAVLNGLVMIGFLFLIFQSNGPAPSSLPEEEAPPEGQVFFSAQTSLAQISTYTLAETEDAFEITTSEEEIVFSGSYELLGMKVALNLFLVPEVTEQGNLILYENSISIGAFQMPGNMVLEAIQRQADLPDWVDVHPEERRIDIRVNDIDVGENLYVRIDDIDLQSGEIGLEAVQVSEGND